MSLCWKYEFDKMFAIGCALSKRALQKIISTATMVSHEVFIISIDGGKDSLSMTASTKNTVNSPDNLVIRLCSYTEFQ